MERWSFHLSTRSQSPSCEWVAPVLSFLVFHIAPVGRFFARAGGGRAAFRFVLSRLATEAAQYHATNDN